MKDYVIVVGYRTDNGLGAAVPTHFHTVAVKAAALLDATEDAIKKTYEAKGNISHAAVTEINGYPRAAYREEN